MGRLDAGPGAPLRRQVSDLGDWSGRPRRTPIPSDRDAAGRWARLSTVSGPSQDCRVSLFLVGAAGTDEVSERPPLSLGERFKVLPSALGAVGTRERRDADGMRAVSRKLEAVLWCAPILSEGGSLGWIFGLTAPRLRTVAESGMDRCCLGTERAGFSAPHPCPDPGRLSRATPAALSGTEVSGTPVLFRGGAVGAPGKGLGEGLLREGLLEPGSAGGRGSESPPSGSLFSRETFFPHPPVLCEAPTPGIRSSQAGCVPLGESPGPTTSGGAGRSDTAARSWFPVCETAGRPGLAGLTLRWPADVPHGLPLHTSLAAGEDSAGLGGC